MLSKQLDRPARFSRIPLIDPLGNGRQGGVPANDQRGAPLARVFDGDGIGGARIDMGAFELQPIPPAAFGDYNHNGTVDPADYDVWKTHFGHLLAGSGTGAGIEERGASVESVQPSRGEPVESPSAGGSSGASRSEFLVSPQTSTLASQVSRDDALLNWLAERDANATGVAESRLEIRESTAGETSTPLGPAEGLDGLDACFAALSATVT